MASGPAKFVQEGGSIDYTSGADVLVGAVIVQGGRLAAAACFLPLTMNPELSRKLGTRHRAGIGVTEESDCLAIIVSEERGSVSVAHSGELEMDIPFELLAQKPGPLDRSTRSRRLTRMRSSESQTALLTSAGSLLKLRPPRARSAVFRTSTAYFPSCPKRVTSISRPDGLS